MRPETIVQGIAQFTKVNTVYESRIGGESGADVVVGRIVIQVSCAVGRLCFVSRPGLIASIRILGGTCIGLKISCPVEIKIQAAIDSAHTIKGIPRMELPIGIDRSDT